MVGEGPDGRGFKVVSSYNDSLPIQLAYHD